jgi:hypothetical protein
MFAAFRSSVLASLISDLAPFSDLASFSALPLNAW